VLQCTTDTAINSSGLLIFDNTGGVNNTDSSPANGNPQHHQPAVSQAISTLFPHN